MSTFGPSSSVMNPHRVTPGRLEPVDGGDAILGTSPLAGCQEGRMAGVRVKDSRCGARPWLLGLLGAVALSLTGSSALAAAPAGDAPAKGLRLEPPPAVAATSTSSPVKVIQRKNFLKVKRLEISPFVGSEMLDAFMSHYVLGGSATYHFTEVFAAELLVGYSPSLSSIGGALGVEKADTLDLKDITLELEASANARPVTSKLGAYGSLDMVFSPVYGKLAWMGKRIINFDFIFMAGLGLLQTHDQSTEAIEEAPNPVVAQALQDQTSLASNFGFGFRAAFSPSMAFKVEGREYLYVESVYANDYVVQSRNYFFMAQAGLSFFFP